MDPSRSRCFGIWSVTFRQVFFYGLGYLSLDSNGRPLFYSSSQNKRLATTRGQPCDGMKSYVGVVLNEWPTLRTPKCDCHEYNNGQFPSM